MGSLKDIAILHGWTYSLERWSGFTTALSKRGFNVIFYKIPGLTAKSPKVWDLEKYTEWLKRQLNKNPQRVLLLGHSNGGRIAINFSAKYPEKVGKLILIDSAGIYHNGLGIRLKRSIFKAIAKIGRRVTSSSFLRKLIYRLAGESDYEIASPQMRKTMVNLISVDIRPALKKIRVPTIIIWGEHDKVTPLSDAWIINKLVKNSKLFVFKGLKHSPFYEDPQGVAEIIKKYV